VVLRTGVGADGRVLCIIASCVSTGFDQQEGIKRGETMKAAVVHSFDKPLAIEDVPKPKADSGEVVVKIETCGLCHSDIHAAHGDWPFKPNLPLIPGHEAVGIVESVGNGVTEVKVIGWQYHGWATPVVLVAIASLVGRLGVSNR
jgi:hypothetical protein